jgi:osmotically-inducible protein OsmY
MADTDLVERARAALMNSPHLPLRHLRAEAERGHIVLRGVVRSYFHKQMAQETLRHLRDGCRIDNQLLVEWEPAAHIESHSEAGR